MLSEELITSLLKRAVREIPPSLSTELWQVTPIQIMWVFGMLSKEESLNANRYRFLRNRTDTRDQQPFIAILGPGGISMWNDTSADDAVDKAITVLSTTRG